MKAKETALGVALVVAVVTLACGQPGTPGHTAGGDLQVLATTTIVADLVRAVAEPYIGVEQLMGPGVDPHLYKASAGDVRRMTNARVIFYSGLHLEGRMSELLEEMRERGASTVAVAECVDHDRLIVASGFSGVHDPHVWFDVRLWATALGCVSETLQALDPEHAAHYRERAAAYHSELETLDDWVRARVEEVPVDRRVLITAHDAFEYFGRAYGFSVKGLLGVSTASEAGTADVRELAAFISEERIPAIFVETSVSPRYVQALQQAVRAGGSAVEIGGSLYSDALGDPGGDAGTYVGTVRSNVSNIVTALAGERPLAPVQ